MTTTATNASWQAPQHRIPVFFLPGSPDAAVVDSAFPCAPNLSRAFLEPRGEPLFFSPRSPGLLRYHSHRAAMVELGSAEQLAAVIAMLA